ncbi:hypothetical protein M758_UG236300 [Ceratodon purpureus]|nr:hypothetical protein M758_UG236300 [Ceratodon purpureus]
MERPSVAHKSFLLVFTWSPLHFLVVVGSEGVQRKGAACWWHVMMSLCMIM